MSFFKITKNDGSLDQKTLEKAVDVLTRISDQTKLQRETSNIQDVDGGHGGLIAPLKIELTSSRDTDGVTLSQFATLKATWPPVPFATSYDVECNLGEVEGEETKNKSSLTNTCFWENMGLGAHVKVRVRSCNSVYKSEWSPYEEFTIPTGSYLVPGPVITAKKLFRWVHASVPKVNRRLYKNHSGFEWQWSYTDDFSTIEKEEVLTQGTGDLLVKRKLSYSNHCVFWVTSLTKNVYIKCRAFDRDNNKGSWSDATLALDDSAATISTLTVGILPLKIGWFKKTQWRLNLEWDWAVPTDGDADMNGSFNIQYRRQLSGIGVTPIVYGPKVRHFVDLDKDDKSVEHNIPLVFAPRNLTAAANGYYPTNLTNLLVRVRSRENGVAGDWFPSATLPVDQTDVVTIGSELWLKVRFVAADDKEDFVTPTSSWTLEKSFMWVRRINVVCCTEGWDAPNNFAFFSIHVRYQTVAIPPTSTGTDWEPDHDALLSLDRVRTFIPLEAGIRGVDCYVPWYLSTDTQVHGDTTKTWLSTKDLEAYLCVKVICHVWDTA